jgi:hypothetical protein
MNWLQGLSPVFKSIYRCLNCGSLPCKSKTKTAYKIWNENTIWIGQSCLYFLPVICFQWKCKCVRVCNVRQELTALPLQKWAPQIFKTVKTHSKYVRLHPPIGLTAATEPAGAPPVNSAFIFFLGRITNGGTLIANSIHVRDSCNQASCPTTSSLPTSFSPSSSLLPCVNIAQHLCHFRRHRTVCGCEFIF